MQLFDLCCDVNSLLAPEPRRRFPTKTDSRYILTYNGNCIVHIIAVANDSRWLSCNCHPTPKVRASKHRLAVLNMQFFPNHQQPTIAPWGPFAVALRRQALRDDCHAATALRYSRPCMHSRQERWILFGVITMSCVRCGANARALRWSRACSQISHMQVRCFVLF